MTIKPKMIYLDVCALSRPFDDQSYLRISAETDAINLILSMVKQKKYTLMVSPVHFIEISSIKDNFEKIELKTLLNKYGKNIEDNLNLIRQKSEELINLKFGVADAAHVAFAEKCQAYFISCDDKLLKKCKKHITIINCANPLYFCEKEGLK